MVVRKKYVGADYSNKTTGGGNTPELQDSKICISAVKIRYSVIEQSR